MTLPRVGIFSLTGCAGDQLALLNLEQEILELVAHIQVVTFGMADSRLDDGGPLDIAFVEGSVCTEAEERKLKAIRARAGHLIALGTCAVWGGIPAMRNTIPVEVLKAQVYGHTLPAINQDETKALPLSAFVAVDGAIPGCPVTRTDLLSALGNLLNGLPIPTEDRTVCTECRINQTPCLVEQKAVVCCGPLSRAGCDAVCTTFGQPCTGCRGPVDDPAIDATAELFAGKGLSKEAVVAALKRYSAPAWVGEQLAERYAADPQHLGRG
ncbi:MAG: hypothetical protein AUJ55_02110 [Proteobacteria bacterium CG1_02_64_396]|nr:MAG: hypothetical protein AUJ55_02110 [Proteobacteria bacterium CG1_02_64_396]